MIRVSNPSRGITSRRSFPSTIAHGAISGNLLFEVVLPSISLKNFRVNIERHAHCTGLVRTMRHARRRWPLG